MQKKMIGEKGFEPFAQKCLGDSKPFASWTDWIKSNPKNPPVNYKSWEEWRHFIDTKRNGLLGDWRLLYLCGIPNGQHWESLSITSDIDLNAGEIADVLCKVREFISTMEFTRKAKKWLKINKDFVPILAKWLGSFYPKDVAGKIDTSSLMKWLVDSSQPKFTYDENAILQNLLKNKSITVEDMDVYVKMHQFQRSANEIVKTSLLYDTVADVKRVLGKVQGAINNIVGHLYEDWLFNSLKIKYKDAKHDGRSGKPDFEYTDEDGDKVYFSVKCYEFATDITINFAECHAEIEAAKSYYIISKKEPKVIIHVYNRYTETVYERSLPSILFTGKIPSSVNITV